MAPEKDPSAFSKAREKILAAQESIPPELFNAWAAYLQVKIQEPELSKFLATANPSQLLEWTRGALEVVHAKQNAETPEHDAADDLLTALQEPANAWKLLRNGLNSVIIQEVFSDVSKKVLDSNEFTFRDGTNKLQISLPNGERLHVLSSDSQQGGELLEAAKQQKNMTKKAVRSVFFSKDLEEYFPIEFDSAGEPARSKERLDTYFVIEKGTASTSNAVKLHAIQALETEAGRAIRSIALQAENVSLLAITSNVLHHLFEKYLVAWSHEQLNARTQYSGVLQALGMALHEGREINESQALELFSPVESDTNERRIVNSLRLIVDGYDTGLDQIEHLYELQSVSEYLDSVKKQNQVSDLAAKLISLLGEHYPGAQSSLSDSQKGKLSFSVEEYLQAIISGRSIGEESKQLLSTAVPLSYRSQGLQQVFDDLLYGYVTDQISLETEKVPAKVSLRIPLVLARMHLQLFSDFINLSSRGISELNPESAPEAILQFASYANRPATVATGCPALPAGMIPKLAGLYRQVASDLKKL